MLSELDDRLSTVKRWSILRTITVQSVAAHCFNVQRLAIRIARVLNITDWEKLYRISQAALHHDDKEAIIGDIPATGKEYIHEDRIDVGGQAWYDGADDEVKNIVKLADLMEMHHFLTLEMHMGNSYVTIHRGKMKEQVLGHIMKHRFPDMLYMGVLEWMAATERMPSQRFERDKDGPNASSRDSLKSGKG